MLHLPFPFQTSSLRIAAILSGGRSRRFGSPKHLAALGGARLVERVASAARGAGARPVAILSPTTLDLSHLLPCRVDLVPGMGPLGGLYTAVDWAGELGVPGTLCIACDMPFLSAGLLRRIAETGERARDSIVVPESLNRRGIEPLCAWYPVTLLREIRQRLADGQLSLTDLLQSAPVHRMPLSEVSAFGDPVTLFVNINTPADGVEAAAIHTRREREDQTD